MTFLPAPALEVSGAINLRDVGGYPAAGGVVRSGVLFRSGNLSLIDDAGRAQLAQLGIRRVVDLRADEEVLRQPSAVGDIPITRVPLFLGSVSSFFEQDLTLDAMYRSLVTDSSERVVSAIRHIAAGEPVLVHCTVGKDRTGVTVALALAAAGVRQEAIVADYAVTASRLPAWRNEEVAARMRAFHPEAKNALSLAMESPAPVMERFLAHVASEFGSAEGYLREHGMAKDEIADLRRAIIASG